MYYYLIDVIPVTNVNPCYPSPCGPNSQCKEINGQAVCSCIIGYLGVPPTCRPECTINSDCNLNEACSNQKCQDPCRGVCGIGAICRVYNHKPICSCPPGQTGNPFTNCRPIRKQKIINYFLIFIYFNTYLFTYLYDYVF